MKKFLLKRHNYVDAADYKLCITISRGKYLKCFKIRLLMVKNPAIMQVCATLNGLPRKKYSNERKTLNFIINEKRMNGKRYR